MKYHSFLILFVLFFAACSGSGPQIENQASANRAPAQKPKDELSAISHTADKTFPANTPGNSAPNTTSGSPMSRAIDVSMMNAEIEKAEKKFEKEPKDAQAKKDLAHAYFVRAFALTDAAQYRAALGDFRKGLKLDPSDEDAQKMHDQIISIFQSIGREPPKEGEEPPPMPFDKDSDASSAANKQDKKL